MGIGERGEHDRQIEQPDPLVQQALDQLEEALYISDLQSGKLSYLNSQAELITGFDVQELQDMGVQAARDRVHPDDRERYMAGLRRLIEHEGREVIEYRWLHRDGTYRWFRNSRRVLRDDQGQPLALVGTLRDITEQRKTRATLREAEAFNTAILESSGALILVLDLQGRIVRFNRACEEIIGYSAEEVIGRLFWDVLIPPDQVEQVRDAFESLCEQGTPSRYENDWLTRDGERRRIAWSNTIVRDEQDNPRYIVSSGMDVSEQRAAEQELRESEKRYRTLFETINEGFALHEILYDEQGAPYDYRFLTVNPAFERQTGLRAEDIVGHTVREVMPDIEPLWIERYARVVETGEPIQFEAYSRSLGRYYSASASRTGPRHFAAIFLDITERVHAEQALRESEERFREVFTHTRDAIYRLDVTHDKYDYANPALENLIGLTPQQMATEGARVYIERLHPQDRERLAEYLDALRNHKLDEDIIDRANRIEYRWRVTSGEYHWFSDQRTLITKPDGTQTIVGSMLDITPVKQSEQRLRELNETLEQRVAERTMQLRTLAAELSRAEERERQRLARILHDHLQQLLVAARLNITTLQRRLTDESAQRAVARVDDVLDEAIRTSRSLTAELSPPVLFDAGLAPALNWLARWMQENQGLKVEVEAEDLGDQPPEGLRAMLFQATRELLFNVVKHAGVNHAKLTMHRVPDDKIELTVRDEGVGFDPSRIGQEKETGFGLFSIRERLGLLGGELRVISAPGQGTQVTMRVPMRGAEVEAAEEVAEQAARRMAETGRGEVAPEAGERPVQVLLVDDHTIMRQGLARMLQDEPGIELAGQADNGQEAVALALMTHPDVVLMDVSMPGMDGVEATRRILAELPDVKVIGLSMHEGAEIAARMRQAGAVDYLSKGGDPADLVSTVRRWAQKEQEQGSPVPARSD
jgi:PAS domain S-box-containing protein